MSNTAPQAETNGVLRITDENLETADYMPSPGIEYEIAKGCIRTLRRPLYDVTVRASKLASKENLEMMDPDDDSYSPTIRLKIMTLVTEGDDLPEGLKGIDMAIVGRAVVDFFSYLTLAALRRSN